MKVMCLSLLFTKNSLVKGISPRKLKLRDFNCVFSSLSFKVLGKTLTEGHCTSIVLILGTQ